MRLLSELYLVKGELFMAALWWFWFPPKEREERNRSVLAATLCAALASIFLGRALAHFLPYRVRPFQNPDFASIFPFVAGGIAPRNWSAFPSDHAMMFSALATGIFFLSRRAGACAHAYWIVFIGLPRVYLGLHHPTDVIAGGLLGAGIAWGANTERIRLSIDAAIRPFRERRPSLFYALFFLLSFQIATMFDEPRKVLLNVGKLLHSRRAAPASAPGLVPAAEL